MVERWYQVPPRIRRGTAYVLVTVGLCTLVIGALLGLAKTFKVAGRVGYKSVDVMTQGLVDQVDEKAVYALSKSMNLEEDVEK